VTDGKRDDNDEDGFISHEHIGVRVKRELPHDLGAEKALIASLILNQKRQ
jgi:hypothetical protein